MATSQKYVVHRGGILHYEPEKTMSQVSILGFMKSTGPSTHDQLIHAAKMLFGVSDVHLIRWEESTDEERTLAEQRNEHYRED